MRPGTPYVAALVFVLAAGLGCFHCAQTVFVCVYDPAAQRLRQPGMEFAVWIFKHADTAPLQATAPPMLSGLLHLLDDGAHLEYLSLILPLCSEGNSECAMAREMGGCANMLLF